MVVIGIGGNTESTLYAFRVVREVLSQLLSHARFSSIYRSGALIDVDQAAFWNAVCIGNWEGTPESLLERLLMLESALGRRRDLLRPKGPRTIDLDLLSCNGEVRKSPRLRLPHPEGRERRFVLDPWRELDPGAISALERGRVALQQVDRTSLKW